MSKRTNAVEATPAPKTRTCRPGTSIEPERRASAIRSKLRIIFASRNAVPQDQAFDFKWPALRKPFMIDQLRAALRPADTRQASRTAGDG